MDYALSLPSAIEFRSAVPGVTTHVVPPVLVPPRLLQFTVVAQTTIVDDEAGMLAYLAYADVAVDNAPPRRLGYARTWSATTAVVDFTDPVPDAIDLGRPHRFTITLYDGRDQETADNLVCTLRLDYTPAATY
uniref:hypothetical protein n=1 Tax=Gordonia sp. B7-2 TaxID=3420932 RepID=UPI003D8D9A62